LNRQPFRIVGEGLRQHLQCNVAVKIEELTIHGLERYVVALNDPTDLPGPDEAGRNGSQHDPEAPRLPVKEATVLLRELFQRERVAMSFEWRRANGAHAFQGSSIVTPRGFFDHELVLRLFRQPPGYEGIYTNDRGDLLRMRVGV
jgi:hypothetical protein